MSWARYSTQPRRNIVLRLLIKSMRPKQWTKNVFVWAALVFDRKLFQTQYLLPTLAGFAIFCLLSSAVYLINDLVDIEHDRQHPVKRNRPLASGQLRKSVAVIAAVLIIVICVPTAFALNVQFGIISTAYLLLMIAYSFYLKNRVIVDVMTIAAGFVLRVAGGVVLVDVERFSPWLYICMTLLALFLGFSKRRHELALLAEGANNHRAILDEYSLRFLDEMINVVASSTVIAYSLYTFFAPNVPANHTMMLTIPFVLYGIFRYLYLIHIREEGGSPEELLLKDKPFFLNVVLFGIAVIVIMYFTR
ncbi:MAG: decaprenyl-phosphate phosphoribosyltransferase [Anaerolineae bacterium]|nr:decaprenyl-phosphate phosphoribosyltransferase [Anaerolineae bacterium]